MKSRSREMLDRAIAAMVAAIEIYNKPDFAYRGESFAIIAAKLRDGAVHFYHGGRKFEQRLQEVALAAVVNFNTAAKDWFGEELSRFNFYVLPLSFAPAVAREAKLVLSQAEKRFLRFAEKSVGQAANGGSPYAVVLNVELSFVRSKYKNAAPVCITTDPSAPAVRLTEEQIKDRYPLDYEHLTAECRHRYLDFKVDGK
jgi:hypothetical protein